MTAKVDHPSGTRLHGTALGVARAAWIALVTLMLGMYVAESLRVVQTPVTICDTGECTFSLTMADTIKAAEISLNFAALYSIAWFSIALPLGYVVVAAVIVLRRSDDWMGLLVSCLLIFLGAYEFAGLNLVYGARPGWSIIASILSTFGLLALALLFYVFPNGKFVPRWSRWLMSIVLLVSLFGDILLPADTNESLFNVLFFVAALPGLGGQIYRLRRASMPTERQQTKWALVGLFGPILTLIAWLALIWPVDSFPPRMQIAVVFAIEPMAAVCALLLPASLAISILRYRLFDIDLIIRRTLIYSTVTGLLGLTYFGVVAVLQAAAGRVANENSPLAVVVSTLVIAALFNPLRRRVQRFVDRRFYRSKYDAQRTLEVFSNTMRDEVDLSHLHDALVNVVNETMQPAHIALWLDKGE